jgi:NifU-like protein
MNYYPDRIRERFRRHECVGEVHEPTALGIAGAPVCGAITRLSLAIDPIDHKISDAKFRSSGCGFAVAAAALLTETLIGSKVPDAAELLRSRRTWNELVASDLGKFSPERRHCAELALDALAEALGDHRATFPDHAPGEEALICTCFFVSERTIENTARQYHAVTIDEVTRACRAGGGCGSCHPLIAEILESVNREVEHDLFG